MSNITLFWLSYYPLISMFFLHVFHYIGFFGAQIFNTILAVLIIKRAGKLFGAYRHVMLVFTLCSMWYSWVEVVTQPVMHMKGSMLIVFIDHGLFPTNFGNYIVCLHCATFGFIISLLTAQFFYRWCVLCRPGTLHLFTENRLFFIFIPPLVIYVFWFLNIAWGLTPTPEKREYMREDLLTIFNVDSMVVPFIAHFYWKIDANGDKIWMFKDLISTGICSTTIGTVSCMLVFFAYSIYRHMNAAKNMMSKKTQDLNKQLFIMLSVQTIFPFITMYIPAGVVINLPFFNLGLGPYTNYTSASIAIYPLIEPLIAMFCIADFRRTILKSFGLQNDRVAASTSQFTMGSSTANKQVA